MKKILGLTLVFVMLITLLAVLPAAAEGDEDGYYAYLDQGITLVHRHGGEEYSVSVAAKEIGETQKFACDCEKSVADYLLGLIDNADSSDATKAVATALLNYGAAAKEYFEYDGADIFGTPETDVTALKAASAWDVVVDDPNGIYLGATLVLDGTMKIRFFFNNTDIDVDYDGNTLDVAVDEARPGYGYFDVNVMPYAMKDYATIRVTMNTGNDETATTTVKYAPINYLKAKADDAALSSMVASIYAYGEAAYAYYYEGCYVYPMDGMVLANGTIDHSKTYSDKKHNFVAGGGEKIALIDLTDIDYDTVTLTPNLDGEAGFVTFLTTEPTTHGKIVNYALNYNDMLQFNEPVTLVIPENAKYLVVTNNYDSGTSCLPNTIVFSDTVTPADNLKDDSLETYKYPMETVKKSQGVINSSTHAFVSNFDWVSAIVSIEGTVFNQVEIEIGENGWVGYCFLTQYPTIDKVVSYAGKNVIKQESVYGDPGEKIIADIPKNAVCMIVVVLDGDEYSYLPASMTFTKNGTDIDPLENIQDATLPVYEYPIDYVMGADGAIIYWGKGENKDKYLTEADGKAAGYYKNAFIDITDTAFDRVTIIPNSKQPAGWAFLTEMPEVGEVAQYVGYQGFLWSDSVSSVDIIIPEDAKYLVVYYEENNVSYIPASITFTQSTYTYPSSLLAPIGGYINHNGTSSDEKAHYLRIKADNERWAFIDITGLDYNTVTLTANANNESAAYAFLTKIPTANDEPISYAMNYSDCIWIDAGKPITVAIPENATCLAVQYNYSPNKQGISTVVVPDILFSNTITHSDKLRDDTLDSYEYPMDAIKPSMGTIADDGNKFIQNFRWVGSFVAIEDTVFDKVTFEIGESGKMYYAFLTAYPTLGQAVSFAGGATSTTPLTGAVGEKISVSIPDDAVCLYIYRHDWENDAPAYRLPASVTFRKVNTLDKLQDPIRDEFSYPMNEVVGTNGAVIYWGSGDAKDAYLTEADGKATGYYKNAFIEITDTVFNYVSFRNNNVKTTGWAFLTEMPEVGEKVSYATGYSTFLWSGSTNPFNVEIPEDAKYLVIYYEEGTANYVPESITFSKDRIDPVRFLQDSSSEYQYPMGAFTPTSTIVHYKTLVYGNFEAADMSGEDWKVVIIDITDTTFTQIQLTNKDNKKKWIGWTFLKEAPVEGEKVVLADGYTGWKSVSDKTGTTIDIPEGAKYFVYWYQDTASSQYLLGAVKFLKKD